MNFSRDPTKITDETDTLLHTHTYTTWMGGGRIIRVGTTTVAATTPCQHFFFMRSRAPRQTTDDTHTRRDETEHTRVNNVKCAEREYESKHGPTDRLAVGIRVGLGSRAPRQNGTTTMTTTRVRFRSTIAVLASKVGCSCSC